MCGLRFDILRKAWNQSIEAESGDQPLVLGPDLEDLYGSLLPGVQPFGSLAGPLGLVLLGPGVSQDHGLVTQHGLQVVSRVLLDAVLQEGAGEGLRFRLDLRLEEGELTLRTFTQVMFVNWTQQVQTVLFGPML